MQCPNFQGRGIHMALLHVKICPTQDASDLCLASSPYPSPSFLFATCPSLGSGSLLADPVNLPVATVPTLCAFPSLHSKRTLRKVFPGASDLVAPSTSVENCAHSARMRTGVHHSQETWSPAAYIHNGMEWEKGCEARQDCLDVTCSYVWQNNMVDSGGQVAREGHFLGVG